MLENDKNKNPSKQAYGIVQNSVQKQLMQK